MKRAVIVVDRDPATAHPLHRAVIDADGLSRAEVLTWDEGRGAPSTLSWCDAPATVVEGVLAEVPVVESYALSAADDGTYAFVRQASFEMDPRIEAALGDPAVAPLPPLVYRADGTVELTLVGTHDALGDLVAELGTAVDYTVASIAAYEGGARSAPVTGRQRAALEAAVEVGYYDVPRTGTLAEVAARLDCAESTASELVRRAQAAVVREATGFPSTEP